MTTEGDFWVAIEAAQDDFTLLTVFADFLQDGGDPRAEGFRAMGRLGVIPEGDDYLWTVWRLSRYRGYTFPPGTNATRIDRAMIPDVWWERIVCEIGCTERCSVWLSLRAAYNALALAYRSHE